MGSFRDVAWQALTNICLFLATFLLLCFSAGAAKLDAGELKLVCYYSNWAIYRPGLAKFTPENINPFLCTHLIYAFAGMNKDYELKPFDSYNDIQLGNYKKFVNLKTYNPKLKLLIAVGGWNEGSKRFSKMVESSTTRQKFIQGAIRFLRQHSFDGLDLDWEYPGFRDGAQDDDKEGYSQLVKELRESFNSESVPKGKSKLLLTMAVPAGQQYIDKGYDVPLLSKHLDFFNLLSYDYHTAHEPQVNHHAPLGTMPGLEDWDPNKNLNLEWTINYYIKKGADRKKLIVGIPTYGRSFTLQDPDEYEIGAPADGPGEKGSATRENGYLAYYEICQKVQDEEWELEAPYPQLMGPYAYKDNQWVGFDDEDIIIEKANYIVDMGLGGGMVWTLDNDDFRGTCYGEQSPLINTLKTALAEAASAPAPRRTTSTTTTTARPSRSTQRASRRQQSKAKTTTAPRSTAPPVFTTPDPGPPFECEEEGFFSNPVDCKKYFWCLDSGPSNLGLVPHAFTCPAGLFFNKRKDSCDYKDNVICKVKTTPATTTTRRPRRKPKPRTTTTTTTTPPPTTTPTTPEPSLPPSKDISKDLKALNVPLDSVKMNGQNLLELLNLLQTLGGINQIHDRLHGRETTELTTTVSPTLPGYVTPRRRKPTTTTQAPNVDSNRDIFNQYETPKRSDRRQSAARSTVRPRGPQFEGDQAEEINEENDEEDVDAAVEESQGTTKSGQQYPFVYHTPNRRRNTEEPQKDDSVTEASLPTSTTSEETVEVSTKEKPAPPARRVVVRVKPASGERRRQQDRLRRVNTNSDESEPDRRGNNYVSAQTVGVRRVVRPNRLLKESEEDPKGSTTTTTTTTTTTPTTTTVRQTTPTPRRVISRPPLRIFRPGNRPQNREKDTKQNSETTRPVSKARETTSPSPPVVTRRTYPTVATGRPAIPAPKPTRASGKPAIPAPPPSARQTEAVTSPPGLTFLPDGSITCIRRGVFRHPKDCAKFVVCFYAEDEQEELDGYIYDCPSGYQFLTDGGRCTPSEMVACDRER